MIDLRALLGEDAFERFMNGVALGRYNLLLGAGASAGSNDRFGAAMPVGSALKEQIATEFGLPDTDTKSLKRVYALARGQLNQHGQTLDQYLKKRFTDTAPSPWLSELMRLQWNQLWSLNIDDTIERASGALQGAARQKMLSISWSERHRQADRRSDEVLLIHLHGKASRAERKDELIFDIASYTNSLSSQHRWLKIFGDDFPTKPFIVIGASIDEEIDLQDIFSEGRIEQEGMPSLIVLKDIDGFQRREYEQYGLVPVEATGEEFIAAVTAELPKFLDALSDAELGTPVSSEALRFLEQWESLKLSPPRLRPAGHDVYLGHEPTWFDATTGLLSSRSAIAGAKAELLRANRARESTVTLLSGEAFSGKSAALLLLAKSLVESGFRAWRFKADEALDTEATLSWIKRQPKTVLLIDDVSDFARDVDELLVTAREQRANALVAATERSGRAKHVRDVLILGPLKETALSPRLATGEISALVSTLSESRRLGVLTNQSNTERRAFFEFHNGKLFSAMAALEDGRGFKQRVSDELARYASEEARSLIASVSLTSRLGYPLPFEVMKTSTGLSAPEVARLIEGELAGLLEARPDGVVTRHRIFGELLLEEFNLGERAEALIRLAIAVAPHVSPEAISRATLYYRIARGLMGAEVLSRMFAGESSRVLAVYEHLESAYDWNARFWDQRALAAADAGRFEESFSWAEQAVSRKRDAMSLTTTGKVLMLRALSEAKTGEWPTNSFELAEKYLADARTLEGSSAEYPIDTFLTYLVRLIRLVPNRDTALNEQIRNIWSVWFAAILTLNEGARLRLDRARRESLAEWERSGFGRESELPSR